MLQPMGSQSQRANEQPPPAPQFEGISSLVLSLFYCSALTSIHDYRKNYSFDFVSIVMSLLFNMLPRLVIAFLPRIESYNLMAAVIICSDFWRL